MQAGLEVLLDLVAIEPDVPNDVLEGRLREVESLLGDLTTAEVSVPTTRAQRLLILRDDLSGHLLAASTLEVLDLSASAGDLLRRALATTAAGLVDLNQAVGPVTG